MQTTAAIGRRSVRAILVDRGTLVTIKRTRPGETPYWTLPGGGVEHTDPTLEAALARELLEELGATARVGPGVHLIGHRVDEKISLEHHFITRLEDLDPGRRYGAELSDPTRGTYDIDRIDLVPEHITALDLRPNAVRDWITANAEVLLACAEAL